MAAGVCEDTKIERSSIKILCKSVQEKMKEADIDEGEWYVGLGLVCFTSSLQWSC